MAYVPYTVYGKGSCPLPIIDIVQTIKSSKSFLNKSLPCNPLQNFSNRRINSLKKNSRLMNRLENLRCVKPKKTSRNGFTKNKKFRSKALRKSNRVSHVPETQIHKNFKNVVRQENLSRTLNSGLSNTDDYTDSVREKKSLQVLFKATKDDSFLMGKDEDKEWNYPLLRDPVNPALQVKRKKSFVVRKKFCVHYSPPYPVNLHTPKHANSN